MIGRAHAAEAGLTAASAKSLRPCPASIPCQAWVWCASGASQLGLALFVQQRPFHQKLELHVQSGGVCVCVRAAGAWPTAARLCVSGALCLWTSAGTMRTAAPHPTWTPMWSPGSSWRPPCWTSRLLSLQLVLTARFLLSLGGTHLHLIGA